MVDTMNQCTDSGTHHHLLLLGFCSGVIGFHIFPWFPPVVGGAIGLILLILLALRYQKLWLIVVVALGFYWAGTVASAVLNTALPLELEKKDVIISGQVIDIPKVRRSVSQRFDFEVDRLTWQGRAYPSPGTIRLKLYQDTPPIRSGQRWKFTARLKQARGYQNPGASFNYETYLFHHRLRATGYVRAQPMPLLLKPQPLYSFTAFRERAADFIRTAGSPNEHAGLITALTLGIRNDMKADDWDVLLATGTIHLVAISGLHIGLVSGLVILLSGWVWRFTGTWPLVIPAPKVAVIVGLLAGLLYALLAGLTIPTQRAVCMLAVVSAALFFHRQVMGRETWLMALTAVLAVDPFAPLAGGLWLSFGAVMILLLGAARIRAEASTTSRGYRRMLGKLWAWSAIQIVLFAGMLPLLLMMFHQFSVIAPLANLIAIPVIGILVVPLALTGLAFYAVGFTAGAEWAFQGSLVVIDILWRVLEWLSRLDFSVWRQPQPPLWALVPAVIGLLWWLLPRAIPVRWIGLLGLLPLFLIAKKPFVVGQFEYHMLEVGQGLASVVKTRNHLLVYDTGPRFSSSFDAGKMVMIPFLQQLGADTIDVLIVSHGDNDHSGGHRSVLKRFSAAHIYAGEPTKMAPVEVEKCRAGQRWEWDGVRFEILSPINHMHRGNDKSCVLKISSVFGSLLLSGDITKEAEKILLQSKGDLAADILQIPHHGSKTSSTEPFLNRVRPCVALVSIGYLNGYGHPHPDVRARYVRRRIPVYDTAEEGAIRVSFAADGIVVQGMRQANQQYWLQPPAQLTSPLRIVAPKDRSEATAGGLCGAYAVRDIDFQQQSRPDNKQRD